MKYKQLLILSGLVSSLIACNSVPNTPKTQPTPIPAPTQPKVPPGVTITPYEQAEIKRQPLVQPPQQIAQKQHFDDGLQLPAFKQLMQQSQQALQQGQLDQAERYAMQAQRLAPQSAENFLYLALIAQRRNQPNNAESLARRGLSFAQNQTIEKQLWQVILKTAQQQNKSKTIAEAQTQLQRL